MGLFEPDERHRRRHGQAAVGATPPREHARSVVVVHSLAHARAAAAVSARYGTALTVSTAPGAAAYLGPAWFGHVLSITAREYPAGRIEGLFDCGDKAGDVMAALRYGLKRIRFIGPKRQSERLAGLAAAYDAEIVTEPTETLDLLNEKDPAAAISAWLGARCG